MAEPFTNQPRILKVAQLGNPVLRRPCQTLTGEEVAEPATQHFIDSMLATMRELAGAGLAAPQVHVNKQIIVIEAHDNPRYGDRGNVPLTILINPKITSFSNETAEDWEGCLSVKDLWGKVRRSTAITVEGLDRDGNDVAIEAEGFYAIVLQHEIDHLYGKLFVDRMEDMSSLCFTAEYQRYLAD